MQISSDSSAETKTPQRRPSPSALNPGPSGSGSHCEPLPSANWLNWENKLETQWEKEGGTHVIVVNVDELRLSHPAAQTNDS